MRSRLTRQSLSGGRVAAALALTFAVSMLVGASGAQAVVVDMGKTGTSPVTYPTDQVNYVGVALVPGTRSDLVTAKIPTVESSGPCKDPALAPDLNRPKVLETGICSHGGSVMHGNETFALVWDPIRRYFSGTKGYVEQFLRDVADGSGTLTSPYAVTTQYTDSTGRAGNSSMYGGACDDFGVPGGSACEFVPGSGAGHNYPVSGCPVSGTTNAIYAKGSNDYCLTDAQVKSELTSMIEQTGIIGRTQPGYTPTLVLLTPPGVETCLDAAGKLCSATTESAAPAQFCSYHSRVSVGGTKVDYVVQPWTALAEAEGARECDEPGAPVPPETPNEGTLGSEFGAMLVSPLSRSQIAAIVNPELNGWFALDGSEIDDNTCKPLVGLDGAIVGKNTYLLQREFNNGGLLVTDPYAQPCEPHVVLEPEFVVPSAINQGKVVEFDGSVSPSSLVVPAAGYAWEFGDGTKGTGPSVEHTYAQGGSYPVKLTLTDRGGYVESVTQTIDVIGPPVNAGLPAISDPTSSSPSNVAVGDALGVSTGSWTGYPTPFTYSYKWLRCNAAGEGCTAIAGANGATYTPAAADLGHTIRVEVTAVNSAGSGTATSAPTSVVVHQAIPPASSGPALVSGLAAVSGPGGAGAGPQEFTLTALLTPESRKALLRYGVALRAGANQPADGVASIFVSAGEARQAHIYFKRGQSRVVVGRGTIKGLSAGTGTFHLRLSKKVMARLRRLHRVVLTVELLAIDKSGQRRIVTVAGRY